jgi:hypothetical protein
MKFGTSTIRFGVGLACSRSYSRLSLTTLSETAATARRPDVADRVQQLRGVEHRVGAQRNDGQPRRSDRPVAVDERRVAEGHLAEDRDVEQETFPVAGQAKRRSPGGGDPSLRFAQEPFTYWNSDRRCTIAYDLSAAS